MAIATAHVTQLLLEESHHINSISLWVPFRNSLFHWTQISHFYTNKNMQKIVLVLNKSHKYSLKKKSASSTLIFYAYVAMLVLHWKATKLVTELTIIPWFQTSLSHRSVLVEEVEVYFEEISLKTMIRPFKSLAPNSRQSLSKSPSTTSFWSVSMTSFNGPWIQNKKRQT